MVDWTDWLRRLEPRVTADGFAQRDRVIRLMLFLRFVDEGGDSTGSAHWTKETLQRDSLERLRSMAADRDWPLAAPPAFLWPPFYLD